MKQVGTTHWFGPNTDATNSSGFTALREGIATTMVVTSREGEGRWWSSTQDSGTSARFLAVSSSMYRGSVDKTFGLSVRCLRD
jgi:uncharacterized protein (TIGR02145 family)